MLLNCGYGRSSCCRWTVALLSPSPGNSPANGLVTFAVRNELTALSRTFDVDRYCRE